MNNKEKQARALLYLPLDINEKIFLWLTHVGLKPVSEITITRRKSNKSNPEKIAKWIKEAGLVYSSDNDNSDCWHVGRNTEDVKQSIYSLHKFDFENEVITGKLFGFPENSVRAYATNKDPKDGTVVWVGDKYQNEFLKDKYYTPYLLFSLSAKDIEEDSRVAKKWADTIKTDVPKLAKWFEDKERLKNED